MISAHLLHSRLCFWKDFDVMIVIIRQLWASSLLLGLHLLVDLDGLDVLVALESLDRVLGELDTANVESVKCSSQSISSIGETYAKPLIRLYSWVILPPWSLACCLAAATSSAEAPSLQVTYLKESVRES